MKYRLSLLLAIATIVFIPMQRTAQAEACTQQDSLYGEAEQNVGTLPAIGKYSIWTRMRAADETHNRYQLEVNKEACFTVGGEGVSSSQWQWVNFQNGDPNSGITYDFNKTTGNQIRMHGIDPAVEVDAILFIADDCIPAELGDNCRNAASIGTLEQATFTSSTVPVSGTVVFSNLLTSSSSEVESVEYSSAGKKIQKNNHAAGLDTTLLSNGTHDVTVKVTYVDGTTASETYKLEVDNPTSAITPIYRWARLNKSPLRLAGILLTIISIAGLGYLILKRRHLKGHHARTHGLD